jgi:hypothetical protein
MSELVLCVLKGDLDVLAHFVCVADLDGEGEYDDCCETLGVDEGTADGVDVLVTHRVIDGEHDELLERPGLADSERPADCENVLSAVRDNDGLPLVLLVLTTVGDNDALIVGETVEDTRALCENSDDKLKTGVKDPIVVTDGDPDSALLADEDGVPELEGILVTLECGDCDALVEGDDERDEMRENVACCVGTPVDV